MDFDTKGKIVRQVDQDAVVALSVEIFRLTASVPAQEALIALAMGMGQVAAKASAQVGITIERAALSETAYNAVSDAVEAARLGDKS